jgi:orotate phosphoribosyltransferase
MNDVQKQAARVLLEIDAVIFTPHDPITFKSGIKSPVYIDNRRIPFWPAQWRKIIHAFQQVIESDGHPLEVIAGIETAGIPHSAALAYTMQLPSVFVRKQSKEHGTRSRVEGGDVSGRHVLLIEDLITTGGSSLAGVDALRAAGAQVEACYAIVSYGFQETFQAFTEAGVRLHTLTTFEAVIDQAHEMDRLNHAEMAIIIAWLNDPHGWEGRYG